MSFFCWENFVAKICGLPWSDAEFTQSFQNQQFQKVQNWSRRAPGVVDLRDRQNWFQTKKTESSYVRIDPTMQEWNPCGWCLCGQTWSSLFHLPAFRPRETTTEAVWFCFTRSRLIGEVQKWCHWRIRAKMWVKARSVLVIANSSGSDPLKKIQFQLIIHTCSRSSFFSQIKLLAEIIATNVFSIANISRSTFNFPNDTKLWTFFSIFRDPLKCFLWKGRGKYGAGEWHEERGTRDGNWKLISLIMAVDEDPPPCFYDPACI